MSHRQQQKRGAPTDAQKCAHKYTKRAHKYTKCAHKYTVPTNAQSVPTNAQSHATKKWTTHPKGAAQQGNQCSHSQWRRCWTGTRSQHRRPQPQSRSCRTWALRYLESSERMLGWREISLVQVLLPSPSRATSGGGPKTQNQFISPLNPPSTHQPQTPPSTRTHTIHTPTIHTQSTTHHPP